MLAAFEKAWGVAVEEEPRNNPKFTKVCDSCAKFREDFRLWGENGYL